MKITKLFVFLFLWIAGFPAQAEAEDAAPSATGCDPGFFCATKGRDANGRCTLPCAPTMKVLDATGEGVKGIDTDDLKAKFRGVKNELGKSRGDMARDAGSKLSGAFHAQIVKQAAARSHCYTAGSSFVFEGKDQMAIQWDGKFHTIRKASDTCTMVDNIGAFKKDNNLPGDAEFFAKAKSCFELLSSTSAPKAAAKSPDGDAAADQADPDKVDSDAPKAEVYGTPKANPAP